MKKTISIILAVVLTIAFSLSTFAISLNNSFKGTLNELDENEYIFSFGKLGEDENPTEIGFKVGDKKYPLSEAALYKAKQSKTFGIGFMDNENILGDSYDIVPYFIDENGEETSGEAHTVNKADYADVNAGVKLANILVNGTPLSFFKETVKTYDYGISYKDMEVNNPTVTAVAKEETSTVSYAPFSTGVNITVTDKDGLTDTYTVNFKSASENTTIDIATGMKTKQRQSDAFTDVSSDTSTVAIRNPSVGAALNQTNINRLGTIPYIDFDIPENINLQDEIIFSVRLRTLNTVPSDLKIYAYEYNENVLPYYATEYFGDYGYLGKVLNPEGWSAYNEVNETFIDYSCDISDYIAKLVSLGKNKATIALYYDSDVITSLWQGYNAGTYSGATDLSITVVTNTDAVANSTGSYKGGEPKLIYSTFDKYIPTINLTNEGAVIEAEDTELDESFQFVKDTDASGGEYILSNSNSKYVSMSRYEINEYFETNKVPLTLTLNCEDEGYYSVYMRVLSQKGQGDYYQRLNNNGSLIWVSGSKALFTEGNKFTYIPMSSYRFNEGINTIEFCYRQDIAIDKFIITKNAVDTPDDLSSSAEPFHFKETTADTSNLYAIPDIKPELARPRLLVKDENIEKVKNNLTHERNNDVYLKLIDIADNDYDCILDTSKTGVDNTNTDYLDYIEANAFLYLLNKTPENANKAITGLLNYLSTYDTESGSTTASRKAGYMAYIAGLVYDWCNDVLTTTKKEEIVNSVIFNFKRTEMKWPPTQYAGFSHGEETILPYMLSFGIAVYGDYSEAYNIAMGKVLKESVPTRNMRYKTSNYNLEGEFYSAIRSGSDWLLYLMLENLGCENLITDNIRYQPYTYVFRNSPSGAYLRDGDGDMYPLVKSSGGGIGTFLSASLFDDSYMLSEFYRFYNSGKFETGDPKVNMSMFLALNNVDLEMKQRDELPLSYYTGDDAGMMTARTSWDEGAYANTMIASFKTPERYVAGHSHRDSGHFYIYYKGPLALDSGVYTGQKFYKEDGSLETNIGSGSAHNAAYAKQTIAHNAMLIYDSNEDTGDIPNNGGQYPENPVSLDPEEFDNDSKGYGEVLGADFGPDLNKPKYTYLKGDITNAYNGKAEEYTRSFMFLNFFDDVYPGALIIFDNVVTKDASFNKKWLLHTQEEPQINGNVVTATNTLSLYNGKITNETLLPKTDDLSITKIGGEGKEYPDINGVNQKAVPLYENNDESGKWRVEISPYTKKKHDMFLNVITVSENDDNIVSLDSEYIENDDFVGVKIRNKAAFFGKEKGRYEKDVTLTVTSDEETIDYYIADLKEGEWQIYKDDALINKAYSKDKGGVITFSGAPGTYTLKYNPQGEIEKSDFDFLKSVSQKENKTKVMYNNVFDSSVEAKVISDKAYVSLNGLINRLDNNNAKITKTDDTLTAEIYEGTSSYRRIEFSSGSKYVNVTNLTLNNPVANRKQVTDEIIKDENGEFYVSEESIVNGIFGGYAEYDKVGDIIRIVGGRK